MQDISLKQYIIIIIPFLALSILLSEYLLFITAALFIFVLAAAYGRDFIIGIIIISLFTLVGDIDPALRLIVHLTDFTLLGILFLLDYGLDFSRYKKIPKSVLYFILLYYSSMILASLLSDYTFAGFIKIIRQTIFFVLAYVLYGLIRDEKDIRLYLTSIVLASVILIFSTIIESGIGGFLLLDAATGFTSRVSGIFANIFTTTAFFIIALPIVITSLILSRSKSSKLFHWILIFLFFIGLILTSTRSAYLSLLFSSFVIFYYLNKKLLVRFTTALLIVVFLFLIIDPLSEISSLLFRIESGLSKREYFWGVAVNIIKDNWLFGIGPGAYGYEFVNYFPVQMDSYIGRVLINTNEITEGSNNSHNFFLVFFSDMGIPGLITAFMLPVVFFRMGYLTVKKFMNKNKFRFYLAIMLTASAGSMFIRGIFDGIGLLSYGFITTDLPFWLMFICLMHLKLFEKNTLIQDPDKGILLGTK